MNAKIENIGKVLVNLNRLIAVMQYKMDKAFMQQEYIRLKWVECDQSGIKLSSDELREDCRILNECGDTIFANNRRCSNLIIVRDRLDMAKKDLVIQWCNETFR